MAKLEAALPGLLMCCLHDQPKRIDGQGLGDRNALFRMPALAAVGCAFRLHAAVQEASLVDCVSQRRMHPS